MKTVIFAGGLGSRISEESHLKPKPMIEIGDKPILWHIMKIYEAHGFNDFVVCLGYKGYKIKEYFLNYFYHSSDVTIDLETNEVTVHKNKTEKLKVTLVETGLNTMTAGRLSRIKDYLTPGEPFFLTYGDGVSDVNIKDLLAFHQKNQKICTVTSVQPSGKFGVLETNENGLVTSFVEKPSSEGNWINGGFFVLNYDVFNYLEGDMDPIMWEQSPMLNLAKDNQLIAFKHTGFWKCMDILRDKVELEAMWASNPKWKVW